MSETTKYFVGVDLHKTILQVCVVDKDGNILEERRFRGGSLEEGLDAVEWMAQWKEGGRFCVEAVAPPFTMTPGPALFWITLRSTVLPVPISRTPGVCTPARPFPLIVFSRIGWPPSLEMVSTPMASPATIRFPSTVEGVAQINTLSYALNVLPPSRISLRCTIEPLDVVDSSRGER